MTGLPVTRPAAQRWTTDSVRKAITNGPHTGRTGERGGPVMHQTITQPPQRRHFPDAYPCDAGY